ncbi:MAG: hypothetical protein JWQ29_1229, partial [Phenylobacterium sp.]|nr:hypothetical protein [Phenylobacterium sp.]
MASDDQANPYEIPSHWPRLRQGPMRLGPLPKAWPTPPATPAMPPPMAAILTGSATPLPPAAAADLPAA